MVFKHFENQNKIIINEAESSLTSIEINEEALIGRRK